MISVVAADAFTVAENRSHEEKQPGPALLSALVNGSVPLLADNSASRRTCPHDSSALSRYPTRIDFGSATAARVGDDGRTAAVSVQSVLILVAAVVYAAGVLVVKRSAELGVGVWRTAFVANVVCGILFQPLWWFGGRIRWDLWWQPLIVALCFVLGQWLTFMSLEKGDVSVATPVLGLKILLVAVLVTLIDGTALEWQLWVAAFLATVAIVLLNRAGRHVPHHNISRTIITAGLAAVSYAFFDVSVQRWSPGWGLGCFLPIAMGFSALLSVAFIPKFRAPLTAIPRSTWLWLLGGTITLGIQSVAFVSTVAHWGQAASANVIYSSRGLWSILLLWILGQWVSSREQHLGGRVLFGRLLGASLMMAAIALVLI